MSDIELIKPLIEQKIYKILTSFNEALGRYYLSNIEVIGVELEIKTEQVKTSKAAILRDFNEVLEQNGIKELYVVAFTLSEETVREGLCRVKIKGFRITIECGLR